MMFRPFVGLAVIGLIVGCGTSAPETNPTASNNATVEEAAKATSTAATATHTVAFKVPGMT